MYRAVGWSLFLYGRNAKRRVIYHGATLFQQKGDLNKIEMSVPQITDDIKYLL